MWLLIIFSAVVNASPGGGVSHAVTTVPFADEAQCMTARNRLTVGSAIPGVIPGHSNVIPVVNGICVQVK